MALKELDLRGCEHLQGVTGTLSTLTSLASLHLSYCPELVTLEGLAGLGKAMREGCGSSFITIIIILEAE